MPLHLRLLLPAFTLALGHALGFIQPVGLLLGTAACVLILLGERRLPAWLWQALVLVAGIALAAAGDRGPARAFGRRQVDSGQSPRGGGGAGHR